MPENDQQQPEAVEQPSGTDESTDWKAKAREWEKRAKQNMARISELEPKAKQFDTLEAASKSELERAQEQANALQRELEKTQREANIASVALDAGLTASQARRLIGDTREELLADAEQIKQDFPASQPNEPRAPRPDPSQGSSAARSGASSPAQEFAALIQSQTGR